MPRNAAPVFISEDTQQPAAAEASERGEERRKPVHPAPLFTHNIFVFTRHIKQINHPTALVAG